MSGHESTYKPASGFTKWLDSRLPIIRLAHDSFVDFPTPKLSESFYLLYAAFGKNQHPQKVDAAP